MWLFPVVSRRRGPAAGREGGKRRKHARLPF